MSQDIIIPVLTSTSNNVELEEYEVVGGPAGISSQIKEKFRKSVSLLKIDETSLNRELNRLLFFASSAVCILSLSLTACGHISAPASQHLRSEADFQTSGLETSFPTISTATMNSSQIDVIYGEFNLRCNMRTSQGGSAFDFVHFDLQRPTTLAVTNVTGDCSAAILTSDSPTGSLGGATQYLARAGAPLHVIKKPIGFIWLSSMGGTSTQTVTGRYVIKIYPPASQ